MLRALLLLLIAAGCDHLGTPGATTVYLVRHAEKALAPGGDPNLTPLGHARALALVDALDGVDLDAIYSTDCRRTLETVQPMADACSVKIRIGPTDNPHEWAERIKEEHRGRCILVAGHINTVPDLLAALGVQTPVTLQTNDYGDLFVVTIGPDGTATLERRRFDP